jgi:Domain of unknown function (DUF4394)/Calx-beta domain
MPRSRRGVLAALVVLLAIAGAPSAAQGARILALTAPPEQLLTLGSGDPTKILGSVPVTGLLDGETIRGMDLRPADGSLYVVTAQGTTGRLRRLDPVAGTLGAPLTLAADPADATSPYTGLDAGVAVGVDFNPVPDRLRIVSASRKDVRVNPSTGLVLTDADINPGTPAIVAVGYTNAYPGASMTTLYDYNYTDDSLYIQNPPNNGTLTVVGPSLITATAQDNVGLDIAADANAAFLDATLGVTTRLYSVNLGTGAASLLGPIGTGAVPLTDIAVAENLVGLTAASITRDENGGALQVTIQREAPRGTTTVNYATADGSAAAGADYTAVSGTLEFGEGQTTATIEVPLTADAAHEPDETFTVTLSNPTPSAGTTATAMRTTATATIRDDDPDRDGDGVPDALDVCPGVADPAQADANRNGVGTACDLSETLPDRTAPVVLLGAADISRAKLRAKGLPFRFSCSEACTLNLTLRVGNKSVGAAKASLAAAGVGKGRARLTKKGKAAARRARSLKLSATATDAAGNRGSDKLTVRLR